VNFFEILSVPLRLCGLLSWLQSARCGMRL
jgi:hypothetical protein